MFSFSTKTSSSPKRFSKRYLRSVRRSQNYQAAKSRLRVSPNQRVDEESGGVAVESSEVAEDSSVEVSDGDCLGKDVECENESQHQESSIPDVELSGEQGSAHEDSCASEHESGRISNSEQLVDAMDCLDAPLVNRDELENSDQQSCVAMLVDELECKEVEIGELQLENEALVQQVMKLGEENHALKQLVQSQQSLCMSLADSTCSPAVFGLDLIKDDDSKILFYTGLPSYKVFNGLYRLLEPVVSKNSQHRYCSLSDELLLCLMKLRLGLLNQGLAMRFNITKIWLAPYFTNG